MRQVTGVGAVHPEDADEVLAHLGIKDALVSGKASCHECGSTLTPEGLAAMRSLEGQVAICCGDPGCLEAFNGH